MADIIYKYGPLSRHIPSSLVVKGVPVRFAMQRGMYYCWCIVDPDNHGEDQYVDIVATGESYVGVYVGTVEDDMGFVWHLIHSID
jgi:hypothetical protein